MDLKTRKKKGIHYTPPELARFLAARTAACVDWRPDRKLTVLDPACGDGQLLVALVEALRAPFSQAGQGDSQPAWQNTIEIFGFDTDAAAVARADQRLQDYGIPNAQIKQADFLAGPGENRTFDCVIANPPYVRTQVLGGSHAQALAKKFNLSGRVDLYQAFTVAIAQALREGGAMGLLTSNRFLTVKSGAAMRSLLLDHFQLQQIFDLGETRLFTASVLPVVLTGRRRQPNSNVAQAPEFLRVEGSGLSPRNRQSNGRASVLELINQSDLPLEQVDAREGAFSIRRGELLSDDLTSVWTIANTETRRWLETLRANQHTTFGELSEIKVGIKTTADTVFIGDQQRWESLSHPPESELRIPLITHHVARRWSIEAVQKSVLYPYQMDQSKRTLVPLESFPNTQSYLESHRERLEGRQYVIAAGRVWFEVWVPHQPIAWQHPKLVWPDIAQEPTFFLDNSGSIVNGDCYWLQLHDKQASDWLYLMLGIANSQLATRFYDTVFHNKLYSGRRRFMTQYVREFPLPDLNSPPSQAIVRQVKKLVAQPVESESVQIDHLVEQAFGLS